MGANAERAAAVAVRRGGAGLGLIFLLLAGASCWGGGQGTYTALRNLSPTDVTMEEYLQGETGAHWLTIHGAHFHVADGAHIYSEGRSATAPTSRVFLPLFASEEDAERVPPRLILETSNPDVVELYNDLQPDMEAEEVAAWLQRHADVVAAADPIQGLVRFGIELKDEERDLLAEAFETDEFALLLDGGKPELAFSAFMLLAGFGFLGLGVWQFGRDQA